MIYDEARQFLLNNKWNQKAPSVFEKEEFEIVFDTSIWVEFYSDTLGRIAEFKLNTIENFEAQIEAAQNPCGSNGSQEFLFSGVAVGILLRRPVVGGEMVMKYEPYRGSGHYALSQSLAEGRSSRCEFTWSQHSGSFVVQSITAYSYLLISSVSYDLGGEQVAPSKTDSRLSDS